MPEGRARCLTAAVLSCHHPPWARQGAQADLGSSATPPGTGSPSSVTPSSASGSESPQPPRNTSGSPGGPARRVEVGTEHSDSTQDGSPSVSPHHTWCPFRSLGLSSWGVWSSETPTVTLLVTRRSPTHVGTCLSSLPPRPGVPGPERDCGRHFLLRREAAGRVRSFKNPQFSRGRYPGVSLTDKERGWELQWAGSSEKLEILLGFLCLRFRHYLLVHILN